MKSYYWGDNCELSQCDPNPCNTWEGEHPCKTVGANDYECTCPDKYSGKDCEITPCDNGSCLNNSTCELSSGNSMIIHLNNAMVKTISSRRDTNPPAIYDEM